MTEDEIIETFNRNLVETGALGARRAAANEIAQMAKIQARILKSMAVLRLERERIREMAKHPSNTSIDLEYAVDHLTTAINHLENERKRHA